MKRIVVLQLFLFLTFATFAYAQEHQSPTSASYERAKRVLDAAIVAHGGAENIRQADKVTINYTGVNHPIGQNAAFAAAPANFERVGARTLIDYSGNRYITEGQSNSAGGYKFNFRVVVAPERSFSIDLLQNRRGNEVRNIGEPQKLQFKIDRLAEVPHLFLLYIAQRPEVLRYSGEMEIDGQQTRAIVLATENGTQMTLYFDARTNLLARTEQLDSHPHLGDVTTGNTFSDYRTIGNVKVPGKRLGFVNKYIVSESVYADVKFDFVDGEKLTQVPPGFVEPAPRAPAGGVMRQIGDGIHLIERLGAAYRVIFIEFEDHVMILEAPTDSNVSKAIIKLVKQTVPTKPIKYVSFSHFHADHTGGLREYIAEGATIVVPTGNKNFVEQIARAKFTLKPDSLSLNRRNPVIETFEKTRRFTDGKRTVELYSIGPVSHVEDMTIFYFPKEKILFQGDMFSPLDTGGIPPIIEINRELVRKVEDLRLDVETLVGVHSGSVAWKDFLDAVRKSGGQ